MSNRRDESRERDQVVWGFLGQNSMGGAALTAMCEYGHAPSLVITRPRSSHENAVEIASAHDGPVEIVDPENEEKIEALIRQQEIELVVCCGWSKRIQPELLSIPEFGWWNLHPSSLPAWRGSNPIGWQLISGASRLGFTVHQMDDGYDTGASLRRGNVPIPPGSSGGDTRRIMGNALGTAAAEMIRNIRDDAPAPLAVDEAAASWCPPRGVLPLLDPSELQRGPAQSAILAFAPFPGVGVRGLPDGWLAVDAEEPNQHTAQRDGLHPFELDFADGPLKLWCRTK